MYTRDVVEQPCSEAGTLISALCVSRCLTVFWQPEETGAAVPNGPPSGESPGG
jgi:hypothetical protein